MFGLLSTEDLLLITPLVIVILLFIGTFILIIRNKYFDKKHKLYWIIALFFFPLHAPYIYWFVGREQRSID